jgi:hypothetical protein
LRNIVDLLGHVSAAEAFDLPDRGMQLSWRRANAVANILVENGIGWNQINIVCKADTDRVAIRTYDQAGHRANQRVEIIETPRSMQGDEPESEAAESDKKGEPPAADKPKPAKPEPAGDGHH